MLEKQFPEKIMLSRECREFSFCVRVCVCVCHVVNKTDKHKLKGTQSGGQGDIGAIKKERERERERERARGRKCLCLHFKVIEKSHYIY